jgi:hypothetical protein
MHDPMSVAHEICWPWKNKFGNRSPIFTIWHVDPETDGSDDSCGWFAPPPSIEEKEKVSKLAKAQFDQIFARTVALIQDKSYAYICYDQDCYGMIYWSWRALKAMGKKGWQYGKRLSPKELDEIYKLATNPVDNFQNHKITNVQQFEDTFLLIWRAFRRFNRKWYQHPRWHIRHWKIQFIPWRNLKRRYWDKCCVCGKRGFKTSPIGNWEGTSIWHQECDRSRSLPLIDKPKP